jgi:hypothetical protein
MRKSKETVTFTSLPKRLLAGRGGSRGLLARCLFDSKYMQTSTYNFTVISDFLG